MSSISDLRKAQANDFYAERAKKIRMAHQLKDYGFSTAATAGAMGLPESTIRSYLKETCCLVDRGR